MKRNFKVQYNPQIYIDIQETVNFFKEKTGDNQLGKRFVLTVKSQLKTLAADALHYQIKYDDIRFIPMHPFSFMAHYRVDEKSNIVRVESIIHTSKNPEEWRKNQSNKY